MYEKHLKQPFAIIISFFLLLFLLPLIILVSFIIVIDSKGGVLFTQKRLGKDMNEFTIYKFRTMRPNSELYNRSKITRVGTFLRKTSIDEIPQLINIIKGDMTFIGPRPILKSEFDDYKNNQNYCDRFNCLPGLFCSVDVTLRAKASRDTQFDMDSSYSKNISFKEDCRIFFGTLINVIKQRNIYK